MGKSRITTVKARIADTPITRTTARSPEKKRIYKNSNEVHRFTLLERTGALCPEGIPKVSQGFPQYRELPLNRKVETLHFTCAESIARGREQYKCDFIKTKLEKYCNFSGHSKRTKAILDKN